MLRSLFIKNYALIEEITVSFDSGLSIITGETGAGKSILLGALGLLLGERSTSDMIRSGAEKAIVEAEFDLIDYPHITRHLTDSEFEISDPTLIIRREINRKGTSRAFVNDSPASITSLKEVGELLVDLHGQHEHQSLLNSDRHISFLDEYASVSKQLEIYRGFYTEFNTLHSKYEKLIANREASEKERSFLEFQLQEIDGVNPKPNEDEEIEQHLKKLEHSEELQMVASQLHSILYDSDGSVFERLSAAKALVEKLRRFDESFATPLGEISTSLESIRELAHTAARYNEHIEADPAALDELRSRQVQINRLKKKYGPDLADVIALQERLKEQLGDGGSIDEQIKSIATQLSGLQQKASKAATELSETRKKTAKKFEKEIIAELSTLGIEQASFIVDSSTNEMATSDEFASAVLIKGKPIATNKNGIDKIEFLLSTNKGESPKPLAKVASGGEVSRIMLSIKTVLSASEQIPVLIFDEIDTGISGRIAQRVGTAMKKLARRHQLISITHLGQIAAFGDHHYIVEKSTKGAATTSQLRLLTQKEHEAEIARLLAGESVTDTSLKAARSLVEEAESLVT
ncbi:MAG TPA: DNA repair protein RecN [Candidatus Kapabacteria bacterium]|nr:DNA repair protein RecN [Candidatus Kapabacteria bacterium]